MNNLEKQKTKTKGAMTSLFKEVKDAVSTRDAASFYGIRVNRNGMCLCPFHSDRHPSMKVDKRYYCFGCGETGDSIDLVAGLFSISPKEAVLKLDEDFHVSGSQPYTLRPVTTGKPQTVSCDEAKDILAVKSYLAGVYRKSCECIEHFAPQDGNEDFPDSLVEAIKEKHRAQYMLDVLDSGDPEDCRMVIKDVRRILHEQIYS